MPLNNMLNVSSCAPKIKNFIEFHSWCLAHLHLPKSIGKPRRCLVVQAHNHHLRLHRRWGFTLLRRMFFDCWYVQKCPKMSISKLNKGQTAANWCKLQLTASRHFVATIQSQWLYDLLAWHLQSVGDVPEDIWNNARLENHWNCRDLQLCKRNQKNVGVPSREPLPPLVGASPMQTKPTFNAQLCNIWLILHVW
jgi:hypothetical protein